MKKVLVSELVEQVRITLDENSPQSEYLETDSDNLELNGIIRLKLLEAIRTVHEMAPNRLVEGVTFEVPDAAQYTNTDGSGHIVLPDDFLRLVMFDMRSWRMPVYTAMNDNSDEYALQKNVFTRGTPSKPVCALTQDNGGNRVLEYYCADLMNDGRNHLRDHRIRKLIYIPLPVIKDGEVLICGKLRESIVNYCAGLTMGSRNMADRAAFFIELARQGAAAKFLN